MAAKWEHRTITTYGRWDGPTPQPGGYGADAFDQWCEAAGHADELLDTLGLEGWEAVSICPGEPRTFAQDETATAGPFKRTVATYEVLLKRPIED